MPADKLVKLGLETPAAKELLAASAKGIEQVLESGGFQNAARSLGADVVKLPGINRLFIVEDHQYAWRGIVLNGRNAEGKALQIRMTQDSKDSVVNLRTYLPTRQRSLSKLAIRDNPKIALTEEEQVVELYNLFGKRARSVAIPSKYFNTVPAQTQIGARDMEVLKADFRARFKVGKNTSFLPKSLPESPISLDDYYRKKAPKGFSW